jgi:arylsulfatase A
LKSHKLALALSIVFCSTVLAADQPNIVLINIDDLGYADIGPFGGPTSTPELDRMAREGMKLTSHYAAPVCTPSRVAMMTGCYPKRALPIPGVLFPGSAIGLAPSEVTIAEVLKQAGYSTACIGKWHLGDQAEFLPTRQGFDYYYGIPYSNDMGLRSEGAKSNPDQPLPAANKNVAAGDEAGLRGDGQPPLPLLENEDVIERVKVAEQHTFTRRYTERAIQYIQEHTTKPFFLYLPHNAVHWPHYPHQDYMGKSGISLQKDWAQEIDWSVGQIMKALRESNLDSNTLVIFTSDNGGPINQGANNKPLRGGKGSTWEGGMRVCTLVRWPGNIPAGSEDNQITAHMDWLPTLAAIGKANAPSDRKLDGKDLSPLLKAQSGAGGHDLFYYFKGLDLEAVRSGPWKLHLAKSELYNLEDDLAESKNVAQSNESVVEKLRKHVETMKGDLGLDGKNAPGIRTTGKVAGPLPLINKEGRVRVGSDAKFKVLQ